MHSGFGVAKSEFPLSTAVVRCVDDVDAHKDRPIRIFREDKPAAVAVAFAGISCCGKLLALVKRAMAKVGLSKKLRSSKLC